MARNCYPYNAFRFNHAFLENYYWSMVCFWASVCWHFPTQENKSAWMQNLYYLYKTYKGDEEP